MADDKTANSTSVQDTKPQVSTPAPKKIDVVPKVVEPIEVSKPQSTTPATSPKKEVKELKDPKGKFDYSGCQTHEVQDGETLFDIAQKYTVALQQLRYFNHISKDSLKVRVGQTLVIPKSPVNVPYGK